MTHSNTDAATLVIEQFALLNELVMNHGVLDLACGYGRNGRYLVERELPVVFADVAKEELETLAEFQSSASELVTLWEVDFEQPEQKPLRGKIFDAILVFNYLHRPLMQDIRDSIRAGGLIFYETFTEQQKRFGRPTNPDFLLKPNELREWFEDWEVLHYFEGERDNPQRAIVSLVARRPEHNG